MKSFGNEFEELLKKRQERQKKCSLKLMFKEENRGIHNLSCLFFRLPLSVLCFHFRIGRVSNIDFGRGARRNCVCSIHELRFMKSLLLAFSYSSLWCLLLWSHLFSRLSSNHENNIWNDEKEYYLATGTFCWSPKFFVKYSAKFSANECISIKGFCIVPRCSLFAYHFLCCSALR